MVYTIGKSRKKVNQMVNLKANPYFLTDEDIKWIEDTIQGMSDEEKVGQLFFQLTASKDEEYLKNLVEKYHVGGCRYNPAPGVVIQEQNRVLQKYSKVPVFIACNTEGGANGACADGATIGMGVKVAATDKEENAYALGKLSNDVAAVIGCNMAFAPVCDIAYNWQNTEVITRAFGNNPERVAKMSVEYLKGAHEAGVACAAKHFPGNGQDFRDAHMSNNVNYFDVEKWDATYGKVYQDLIDNGLEAIMGGHIFLPKYAKAINPELKDEEMMPATLSKEIMTGLLRDRMGFNGMVVTDASHMIAMTNRMTRKEMLPCTINAGCDMFLFFNDPDEDFNTMLEAYKSGIISEERMREALTRILGLKAHMGLHKKKKEELVPTPDVAQSVIGKSEYKDVYDKITEEALTLVKYKDEGVLPITPNKYKRIMIVHVKGAGNDMMAMMGKMMGMGNKKNPAEILRDKLIEKGFDAFIYESPIDLMKKQVAAGQKPDINMYFAGKFAIEDFKADKDLVITLCDVANGRPSFGFSKGGGEIPWYVFELLVVVVGCGQPTMLADIPQARTYINTYDGSETTINTLVEKLMTGPEAFKGVDPIDSYCGLFDARL